MGRVSILAQLLGGCFFFSFFLYYEFIVFRYKKLHAASAMEKTKPINQKLKQKKP